jgi:hypothetical protein
MKHGGTAYLGQAIRGAQVGRESQGTADRLSDDQTALVVAQRFVLLADFARGEKVLDKRPHRRRVFSIDDTKVGEHVVVR